MKVADGSDRGWAPAVASALARLDRLDDDLAGALHADVLGGGEPVGEIRSAVVWS